MRDSRDIVISGSYYFSFSNPIILGLQKIRLHKASHFVSVLYNKVLSDKRKCYKMTNGILYGNNKITRWLKIPREKHYLGYKHQYILFIKYEDLIDDPEKECLKILSFLKVQKSIFFIQECIENQYFQKRKKEAQNQENLTLKKLIRKGIYGNWKKVFSEKEILLFRNTLKSDSNFYEF